MNDINSTTFSWIRNSSPSRWALAATLLVSASSCMNEMSPGARTRNTGTTRAGVVAAPAVSDHATACLPRLNARDEHGAVLEAATYVRRHHPEFFTERSTRDDAYNMMTVIINMLRANGHNVRRTLANPSQPPSNTYRWGSDALIYDSGSRQMIYDIYISWPLPATPHVGDHGQQQGEVTSDLVAIGSGVSGSCSGNGSSGGGSTPPSSGSGGGAAPPAAPIAQPQGSPGVCTDEGSYMGNGYHSENHCRHTYSFQISCVFENGCWRPQFTDPDPAICSDEGSYSGVGYPSQQYCEHTYRFEKTCVLQRGCWRPEN
jgi:hypothetical protein